MQTTAPRPEGVRTHQLECRYSKAVGGGSDANTGVRPKDYKAFYRPLCIIAFEILPVYAQDQLYVQGANRTLRSP